MLPALAEIARGGRGGAAPAAEVWVWSGVLALAVIVGAVAIMLVRRWMSRGAEDSREGFTLHDLRSLHAQGRMTDEEFDRAREALIARLRGPSTPLPEEPREGEDSESEGAAGSSGEESDPDANRGGGSS